MNKDCNKINRGMVFWFDLEAYMSTKPHCDIEGNSTTSHLQIGTRPWLVVSIDLNNYNSPICNVVPLTTGDKSLLPCHVTFRYNNIQQTILCEQIQTVDIDIIGKYMCTVSDDIMRKVERSMMSQFGIRQSIVCTDLKLSSVIEQLQKVVDKLIKEKESAQTGRKEPQEHITAQIEDPAVVSGDTLESLLGSNLKPQKADISQLSEDSRKKPTKPERSKPIAKAITQKYEGMSASEKFNAKYGITKKPLQSHGVKVKRNNWTVDNRKQFLEDCENLSPQEIMKKWNFTSLNSVFQTKYVCKNIIEGLSTGDKT